jgi:hypothetical protein
MHAAHALVFDDAGAELVEGLEVCSLTEEVKVEPC